LPKTQLDLPIVWRGSGALGAISPSEASSLTNSEFFEVDLKLPAAGIMTPRY
jgi:hypothetical protein